MGSGRFGDAATFIAKSQIFPAFTYMAMFAQRFTCASQGEDGGGCAGVGVGGECFDAVGGCFDGGDFEGVAVGVGHGALDD